MNDGLNQGRSPALLLAVGLCFFATGAAGLMYEVIWNHSLALVMGNTAYALATLLTVFMGGLALGAWIGGRWAPPGRLALRAYGLLELALGLYCAALPWLLAAAAPLFAWIYRSHYGSLVLFNLMQFCVVGVLLLIPTTMMGATLPILTRFVVGRQGAMSRAVALLYATNSGGAFAGAMLAGLVLLPAMGVRSSYLGAVAINVAVGATALVLSLGRGPAEAAAESGPPRPAGGRKAGPKKARAVEQQPRFSRAVLLVGFCLSGFAAMVYQVSWTRAVTMSLGSSTYAFTLIAGVFILGLTLGSLALGWLGDRPWGRYAVGVLPLAIGLFAVVTVVRLGDLPVVVTRLLNGAQSFGELEWGKFRVMATIFLPPTICMGGLLPIVSRLLARGEGEAARSVGEAYAANAAGTILGSFCGGFLLIPWVGMRGSILVGAGLSLLVGAGFLYQALDAPQAARMLKLAVVLVPCALALAAAPSWDRSVLTSGPFIKAREFEQQSADSDADIRKRMEQNIIYYKEGVATLVTVTEEKSQGGDATSTVRRELVVGGKPDAFSYGTTQNWLGHLPMFLRPDARRVLIIGLGSGHTLGSVLRHPTVERVDCVEISAEVAFAAKEFFGSFTGNALSDPRVNLIIGDGRLHLEHSDQSYDVIISQPSNPWIAGAASLFTREAFQAMNRHLRPGGLACIWFQGFRMPVETFRTLARTWAEAWPHPSVWTSRISGEHLFVGSELPLSIDFATLEKRFRDPRVNAQMNLIKMPTAAHVMGYLTVADEGLLALAGTAPVNTDNNSRIAFDTPRGMARDHTMEILSLLHAQRVDPWRFVRGSEEDAEFLESRELGARILADQYTLMRALDLSADERRPLLEQILQRNPFDATAERELRRISRSS